MKFKYIHCTDPNIEKTYDSDKTWEKLPSIFKGDRSCEDYNIHDLQRFRRDVIRGIVLQYEVIEGNSKDFMKPWTEALLADALDKGLGEADICRCSFYNDFQQRCVCTMKVQDLGDEQLQILCNVTKEKIDEAGTWVVEYDKDYYCEKEEYKSIEIKDFVLLSFKDYETLISDAIDYAESGKEQVYWPPRTAGNYTTVKDR